MRIRNGLVLGLFAAALLVPGLAWSQAKVGTTGYQFLEIGASSRAVGMGDAFVALVDDASAVYYNPAGLTGLDGPEVIVHELADGVLVERGRHGPGAAVAFDVGPTTAIFDPGDLLP